MKKWWIYEKLKKKILKKKGSSINILSINKNPSITLKQYFNIISLTNPLTKTLNCHVKICKNSRKFKKTIKMGKTTRWVFYHNLKKNKIPHIFKYVW